MPLVNHRITLAARPVGLPTPTDFHHVEEPVREPAAGEVLVKNRYISLDPAMRGWMNDAQVVHPADRARRGDARGRDRRRGRVEATRSSLAGDHVTGMFGVQEYATVAARA